MRRFCDALTVLRNGRDVGGFKLSEITDDHVIQLIVGRELASAFPECPELLPERPTILSADRLAAGRLEEASFNLTAGEIVGVAGLQGMGQLDLSLPCSAISGREAVRLPWAERSSSSILRKTRLRGAWASVSSQRGGATPSSRSLMAASTSHCPVSIDLYASA